MAKKTRPPVTEIGQVLIPGRFIYAMSALMRSLDRKIMDKAVIRAFARKTGPHAGRVTTEDMLQSAQEIFPSATVELEEKLTPSENPHVGRKAS